MTFSKSDFWRALIAGESIALLALPIFKNLGFFDLLSGYRDAIFSFFVVSWFVFLPLATGIGLYVVYRISIPKWSWIYQIGKYGIVGLLNSFLTIGILNFFILISGIAKGLWFDFFFVIACWGGVTNAFFWNKFWTFNAKHTEKIRKEYVKFFAVSGATTLINVFLIHILVNIIGVPPSISPETWVNIASISLIPVSFFGNFFGYRIFVFKNNP